MIRHSLISIFSFLFLLSLVHSSFGQNLTTSLTDRFQELKSRANAHENYVAQLLAKPGIQRTDFSLPEPIPRKKDIIVTPPEPEIRYIPIPENLEESNQSTEEVSNSSVIVSEVSKSNPEKEELDKAYAKLYEPDEPARLNGYYFGPVLGVVIPQDGSIRTSGSPMVREPYEADSGYLLGVQVGKDFGAIRVEAEYSYHSFDASSALSSSLSASIHNFFSRVILEKELGESLDLRFGLGMGMGIVGLDGSNDYSGTGFAYDFIFGAGYRLGENWSIQADYRYFLTAANDNYDHIKSHLCVLSANFDL